MTNGCLSINEESLCGVIDNCLDYLRFRPSLSGTSNTAMRCTANRPNATKLQASSLLWNHFAALAIWEATALSCVVSPQKTPSFVEAIPGSNELITHKSTMVVVEGNNILWLTNGCGSSNNSQESWRHHKMMMMKKTQNLNEWMYYVCAVGESQP